MAATRSGASGPRARFCAEVLFFTADFRSGMDRSLIRRLRREAVLYGFAPVHRAPAHRSLNQKPAAGKLLNLHLLPGSHLEVTQQIPRQRYLASGADGKGEHSRLRNYSRSISKATITVYPPANRLASPPPAAPQ